MYPVTLIYPYYECPAMLERQVENWNRYAGELKKHVSIMVIDDGSPTSPALPIVKTCRHPIDVYRIKQDIPWNQHGARNLGAKVAGGADTWLFMSDMDVLLTPEAANTMQEHHWEPKYHYTFERALAPNFTECKIHCNTFLVRSGAFWLAGGYDEDYCGTYGGDGPFLRALSVIAPNTHMTDVVLLGYGRHWREGKPAFKGADTNLDRAGYSAKYRQIFDAKRVSGDERAKNPIRFEWEKQL